MREYFKSDKKKREDQKRKKKEEKMNKRLAAKTANASSEVLPEAAPESPASQA